MSRPSKFRTALWRTRRKVREWLVAARAPWPMVAECHVRHLDAAHSCGQCDGSHDHRWVAWSIPRGPSYRLDAEPGRVAVRCRRCGARKCDVPGCVSVRHHRNPHATPADLPDDRKTA